MKQKIILTLICVALCYACNDPKLESRPYPSIDTNEVIDITSEGATLTGEVLALGSSSVQDYGFVYSNHKNSLLNSSEIISLGKLSKEGKISAHIDRNLPEGQCYYNTYAVTADGLVVYGPEKSFESKGGKPPVLDKVIPSTGFISDKFMLIGSGFSDVPSAITVSFGGFSAQVVKSNGDTIFCVVPIVYPGNKDVKVSIGSKTTDTKEFQVQISTFTSFTPQFVTFGDTVYLSGSNFPSLRSSMFVIFLGRQPTMVKSTPTLIKVVVPDNVTQTQSTVSFNLGFTTIDSEILIQLNPPVIEDFTPSIGSAETEVIITGKNFNPIPQNNKVTIGGVNATVVSAANKTLVVKVPAVSAGDHTIDVTILGQKGTSSGTFKVQ
jgi:hypothetical protein